MKKDNKKQSLLALAKYTNFEITLEALYMQSGAHQAKINEKFMKNKNYIRNQTVVLKVVSAFIMLLMPFLGFIFYFEIVDQVNYLSLSMESTIIVFGTFIGIIYIMIMLYITLFGLFTTSSLMSGTAFKWIQTLPLSRKKIKKLGFMSLLRNNGIMIIVMTFSFPIVMGIVTQSILTFFMSLISSFLITIFGVSLLIIVGERFSHLFSERSKKSSKSNIFRMISLLSYFIIAFGTGLVINVGFQALESMAYSFSVSPPSENLPIILSLIPFIAPGFLVGLTLTPGVVPINIWFSAIGGLALFALLTFVMYNLAIKSLNTVAISDYDTKEKKKKKDREEVVQEVELNLSSPVKSYIKKDLVASSKDYQSLIFILMPIVYPLIMIFSLQAPIIENVSNPVSVMILWSIIMGAMQFIPLMLVGGLLSIEESGSSILAALPIVPRDQAKAKIILMLVIHSLSLILMAVILTFQTQSFIVFLLLVSSLPIAWTFLLLVFEMKIALFGKMKYRYVLEAVNKRHGVFKWIGIVVAQFGLYFGLLLFGSILFISYGINIAIISILLLGLVSLSIMLFTLYRMFPKAEKLPVYETGSFLRNHPIVGGFVILILFNLFPFIATLIETLFMPLLLSLPYVGILFIEFFLIEGFLVLLFLYVLPKGMKLPSRNRNLKDYLREIRFTKLRPFGPNLLAGFGMFIIFLIIAIIGANLLGDWIYFPEILIMNPGLTGLPGLLSLGWFAWIFMLRPGIWEEVAFRGTTIPLLSKKYSQITTIIMSSIFFGLAHGFNVIQVIISGGNTIVTIYQMIYSAFIGASLGYAFLKTKSLLPCMIYHYLIDTIGITLIQSIVNDYIILGFEQIVFVGLIPMVLNIIFIKLISPLWKNFE